MEITLVHMSRATPVIPGGPTTADVHPDELEGYQLDGWAIVEKPNPTLEQWIDAGYLAENYPPQGYEAVESPAWTAYRDQLAAQAVDQVEQVAVVEPPAEQISEPVAAAPASTPAVTEAAAPRARSQRNR